MNKDNSDYFQKFVEVSPSFSKEEFYQMKVLFEKLSLYSYQRKFAEEYYNLSSKNISITHEDSYSFNDLDREYFAVYSDNDLSEFNEEEFFKILEVT